MLQRSSKTTGHILRSPNRLQTCTDLSSDQKATTLLGPGKQAARGKQRKGSRGSSFSKTGVRYAPCGDICGKMNLMVT